MKSFRIAPPSTDDDELLALLLADDQFRDDYAGGGTDPTGQRHGPYWLRVHGEFQEYVTIDRDQPSLTLIVAADD